MAQLIKIILFSMTLFLSPGKVHQLISSKSPCATRTLIGKSHKGKPLYSYTVTRPSLRNKRPVMVLAGVHGEEKHAVVLAVNLLNNLCLSRYRSKLKHPWIVIPLLNPDGYSRRSRQRRNAQGIDLNRDAFRWKTPEGKAFRRWVIQTNPIRVIDNHMYGNIFLYPRPWTRAYPDSRRFVRKTLRRYLQRYSRNGIPRGMLYSWTSELGVPSALIEIGRKGDHVKYEKWRQKRNLKPALKMYRKLFSLEFKPPTRLRKGSATERLRKYECRRRKRRRRLR